MSLSQKLIRTSMKMFKFITLLLILSSINQSSENNNLDASLKMLIEYIQKNLFPVISRLESNNEISINCSKSLRHTLKEAYNLKTWAIQSKSNTYWLFTKFILLVLESSGRFPIGITDGTLGSLGDFDECLSVRSGDQINPSFVGQYCSPKFSLPLNLSTEYSSDTFHSRVVVPSDRSHT